MNKNRNRSTNDYKKNVYNPLDTSRINYAIKDHKEIDIPSESAFSYLLQLQYLFVLMTQANEQGVDIEDAFIDRYFKIKDIELTMEDETLYIDIEQTMKNMQIPIPKYWNDPEFKEITDYHNLEVANVGTGKGMGTFFSVETINMTIYDYLRNEIAKFLATINETIGKEYNKVSSRTNKYKNYDSELSKNFDSLNKAFNFKDINDINNNGELN